MERKKRREREERKSERKRVALVQCKLQVRENNFSDVSEGHTKTLPQPLPLPHPLPLPFPHLSLCPTT